MNNQSPNKDLTDNEVERLLQSAPPPVSLSAEQEKALWVNSARLIDRIAARTTSSSTMKNDAGQPLFLRLSIAAALFFAVVAGISWIRPTGKFRTAPWENTAATPVSQVLNDGTRLEIHPETRVAWLLNEQAREVYLYYGEIFFDVKSSEQPFMVLTPGAKIRAVGTRFGVKVSKDGKRKE